MSKTLSVFLIAFLICVDIALIFPGTARFLFPPLFFVTLAVTWYEFYKMAGVLRKIWRREVSLLSLQRKSGPLEFAVWGAFLVTVLVVGSKIVFKIIR